MLRAYGHRGSLSIAQGSSPWPGFMRRKRGPGPLASPVAGLAGWQGLGVVDPDTGMIGPGVPLEEPQRQATQEAMARAVYELRSALTVAQQKVADTPISALTIMAAAISPIVGWLVADSQNEVTRNVANGLVSVGHMVDQREAEEVDVLEGRLDPARWLAAVQATGEAIGKMLEVQGEYSTKAVLFQALADVKDQMSRVWTQVRQVAVPVLAGLGTLLVVGGVLAGLLVFKLYFPGARAMGGFHRGGRGRRLRTSRRRR